MTETGGSLPRAKRILLTGRPGCGKTTAIRRTLQCATGAGGFYTGEIREGDSRTGFSITALDGRGGILAAVGVRSKVRVGKYGVNLRDIDEVAASSVLSAARDASIRLIVIDEIAAMEIASDSFRNAVIAALESGKKLLGSIQERRHPFLDRVRAWSDLAVVEVNAGNRDGLPEELAEWVEVPRKGAD